MSRITFTLDNIAFIAAHSPRGISADDLAYYWTRRYPKNAVVNGKSLRADPRSRVQSAQRFLNTLYTEGAIQPAGSWHGRKIRYAIKHDYFTRTLGLHAPAAHAAR